MPGPGGPGGPRGGRPMQKPKNASATVKRIFKYLSEYHALLVIVVLAIILSSLAGVIGTSYMRSIIDVYLEPMVTEGYSSTLMSGFIGTLLKMAAVYLTGAVCTYLSARLMLQVSTKALYRIRVDMFTHM